MCRSISIILLAASFLPAGMPTLAGGATTTVVLLASTFGLCLLSGVVPVINVELYLISAAAVSPRRLALPLILLATSGQMVAKSLLYLAGRGTAQLPAVRLGDRVRAVAERMRSRPGIEHLVLLGSAVTGLPPFYAVSIASGALRVSFTRFLLLGWCGRCLRFSGVVLAPQAVRGFLG